MKMARDPFHQLAVIKNVSRQGRMVTDCYRLMYKKEIWYFASEHFLQHHEHACSLKHLNIPQLIQQLQAGTFRFDMQKNTEFQNKLVLEVIVIMLNQVYGTILNREQVTSHHILANIKYGWKNVTWCIRGNIPFTKNHFYYHCKALLANKISDRRFLQLIHHALKSDVFTNEQRFKEMQSILWNLLVRTFDTFMADFKAYNIKYHRYQNQYIIGIPGKKKLALHIKSLIAEYLSSSYTIESDIHISNLTSAVPFLGYTIEREQYVSNVKRLDRIRLVLPFRVMQQFAAKHHYGSLKCFAAIPRPQLINCSELQIMQSYNAELKQFANYYKLATNFHHLRKLIDLARSSFIKTIAKKRRSTPSKVAKELKKCKSGRLSVKKIDKYGRTTCYQFIALADLYVKKKS